MDYYEIRKLFNESTSRHKDAVIQKNGLYYADENKEAKKIFKSPKIGKKVKVRSYWNDISNKFMFNTYIIKHIQSNTVILVDAVLSSSHTQEQVFINRITSIERLSKAAAIASGDYIG